MRGLRPGDLRLSRLPVLLRALLHPLLVVLAGVVVGLALEVAIQLFGAMVVPDAFAGLPAWYHLGKAVLFELARVIPPLLAGMFARRRAGVIGATTAVICALAADVAFHGAMPGAVSELVSPLAPAAGAAILGAICGLGGAQLAQHWRTRRVAAAP
jgi:hypothetical protein